MQELQVIQQEMAAQGWDTGQAQAATFQPFIWKIDISTDTIAVGLVDDRYGHHILVLVAKIQVRHILGTEQPCALSKQYNCFHPENFCSSCAISCNPGTVREADHVPC